jgi:hypothetical protein
VEKTSFNLSGKNDAGQIEKSPQIEVFNHSSDDGHRHGPDEISTTPKTCLTANCSCAALGPATWIWAAKRVMVPISGGNRLPRDTYLWSVDNSETNGPPYTQPVWTRLQENWADACV